MGLGVRGRDVGEDGITGCEIRIFFHWPGWKFA